MADDESDDDEVVDYFPGLQITIQGLSTRPELNGKAGRLKAFDAEKGRWKVEMEDGSGLKLFRQQNLEPRAGAAAVPAKVGRESTHIQDQLVPAETGAAVEPASELPERASLAEVTEQPLLPGKQVLVSGLEHEDAQLNGQTGVCESFLFNKGKWLVRFEDGAMKPVGKEHLTVQPPSLRAGAYVRLEGLLAAPHLNGKAGICERLDPHSQRWRVRLESGDVKMMKRENLAVLDGYAPQHTSADFTMPGDDRPRAQASESASFCSQLEQLLASGEIQWEDY